MSAASTKKTATVPEPGPGVAQSAISVAGAIQHGGDRRRLATECGAQPEEILDFSASINPLGPPEWLRPVVSRYLSEVRHYPEPRAAFLRETLAQRYGVPPTSIATGNGLNEFFYIVPRLPGIRRTLIPAPAYQDYARGALACDVPVEYVPGTADYRVDLEGLAAAIRPGDLVYLGHPGNPAGHLLDRAAILELARAQPETLFAIDEAFLDFTLDPGADSFLGAVSKLRQNLLVLKSFTKFYAIPGLRLGCVVAGETLVQQIDRMIPDWSVNTLAQAVGVPLVRDDDYAAATREAVNAWRTGLAEELGRIDGIDVLSGLANFLLCRVTRRPATPREAAGTYPDSEAAALRLALLHRHRIAIRVCDNMPGLGDREFRVAVRTPAENARLLDALREVLGDPRAGQARAAAGDRKSRTPAVMLQGTSSNAGKSVLTTALCRILLQDGLRVAPFKAQNMSLNSFVTADGREIARAQATQAAACRLAPDIRMSPILLKPNTECGSQVLVHGRPVAHMSVLEYQQYKATAFEAVRESYDALASDYDVIVLEGAGSPGEVNLKHNDIVNMRMARHAQSPVLLVGDIDRGGVFAGFVGIMETLAEWERELVAGYIVNRFRGDASLLADAFRYMREHTARDVLGVVPYIPDPGIPEEDSVSFKAGVAGEPGGWSVRAAHGNNGGAQTGSGAPGRCLDIVVINLPLISNFTDFDALALEPDVVLRFVSGRHASTGIGQPDALILPGTKNTLADLADLRANGLAEHICQLAAQGYTEIVGICGGFQMLGAMIHDAAGVESTRGSLPGLDLLPMETGFASEKTLRQAALTHRLAGLTVRGYEIHHGQTRSSGGQVILESNGELCGLAAEGPEARVWGAYLHGIFDADEFRRWFLDRLRARRGLEPLRTVQARYDLEPAIDRLAAVVREGLQMEKIYRILGV